MKSSLTCLNGLIFRFILIIKLLAEGKRILVICLFRSHVKHVIASSRLFIIITFHRLVSCTLKTCSISYYFTIEALVVLHSLCL